MGYVLGSQLESVSFADGGPQYGPAGAVHAVDTESSTYVAGAELGYAVCGCAVRVWPEKQFDPHAANAHAECAANLGSDWQPR